MFKRSVVAALVAVACVVTVAMAAVIFDAATGTGWVGKGDVQMAFGWNNAAMQQRHTQITFEYDAVTTHSWQCEWTTGPDHNTTHHVQNRTVTSGVAGVVASDSRKTGQWTGWHLTGFTSSTGDSGEVTPHCPGNSEGGGNSGAKTVVEGSYTVESSGGGLYAVYQGDRRQIQ